MFGSVYIYSGAPECIPVYLVEYDGLPGYPSDRASFSGVYALLRGAIVNRTKYC